MNGIDPAQIMRDVGSNLDRTRDPALLNRMPHDLEYIYLEYIYLEYIYEVLDPELAEDLMERVPGRLKALS